MSHDHQLLNDNSHVDKASSPLYHYNNEWWKQT